MTLHRFAITLTMLIACSFLFSAHAAAQFDGIEPADMPADLGLFGDIDVGGIGFGLESDTEPDSSSSAVLKTDPDLESILEKANRFAADGNYRVAVELWQAVLERSGDALHTNDEVIYYSLADQVERTLAGLPAEGLRAYRVRADANARALLAAAGDPNDPVALGQVVRNYFPSSVGDDAAFRLGCLMLDQYDFVGALRLFRKVVDHYPDTDLSADQIQLRIALCHAYLGNPESAQLAIDRARALASENGSSSSGAMQQLEESLDQLKIDDVAAIADRAVRMHLSDANRHGVMPALPADFLDGDLEAKWQFWFEPDAKARYSQSDTTGRMLSGSSASSSSVLDTRNGPERDLIDAWTRKNWRPAGQLLLQDDQIFFRSAADITAWNLDQINSSVPQSNSKVEAARGLIWRSLWRNAFEVDTATQMLELMKRNYGAYNLRGRNSRTASSPDPASEVEIQLFGDSIYQQMSLCDGVLYAIEGQSFEDKLRASGRKVRAQYNTSIRRTRKNWLTAYEAKTGRLLWTLPRENTDTEEILEQAGIGVDGEAFVLNTDNNSLPQWIDGGGFMAAPVAWQGLVLVPINSGGAISVCALDPVDGHTVWKSFLCDEPETGAAIWSPIHLSIDGSDLFVGTGLGAVFVLDPSSGQVRFARRYPRSGSSITGMRHYNGMPRRLDFSGWSGDVIIPYKNQMVCFCSDAETIFSLDRSTGQAIWVSDMNPIGSRVDYLLGVVDGTLFAAGPDTIIAYDLDGEGRMVWGAESLFDDNPSRGRGMLTADAIYVPVDDGIYKFSLTGNRGKAEVLAKVGVNFGTNAPVGNLYSDGQQIWVHGANRVYRLGPVDRQDDG